MTVLHDNQQDTNVISRVLGLAQVEAVQVHRANGCTSATKPIVASAKAVMSQPSQLPK